MLHIVPRIDDLETRFGFTNNESGQTYVLLGLPSPISVPAFEKYGSSCVGAYVVRVMPSENIPYGPVCLAIWPNNNAFESGIPASAIIEMGQLLAKNNPTLKQTWMRLGVSLYMKDEEVEPIMEGRDATLLEILRDGRGIPDGDSYIPSGTMEEFNEEYGTKFEGEPEFCL